MISLMQLMNAYAMQVFGVLLAVNVAYVAAKETR
jgi:hypothetical protein